MGVANEMGVAKGQMLQMLQQKVLLIAEGCRCGAPEGTQEGEDQVNKYRF